MSAASAETPGLPAGRRDRGIRARIAALVVSSVVIVAAGAGTWLIEFETGATFEDLLARNGAILEAEASSIGAALARGDAEGIDGDMQELIHMGERLELLRAVVLDHEGRIVASASTATQMLREREAVEEGPSSFDFFASKSHTAERGIWWRHRDRYGEPSLAVSMPATAGLRWGTVVATFNMVPFEERLAVMRLTVLATVVACAMLLLFALVVGLERAVLQPIARLGDAARALAAGDLGSRVQLRRADELGDLGATFNAMATALEENTAHLEQKVAERTSEIEARSAELKTVNQQLEDAVQQLGRLATTDPLTGFLNRRAFVERLGFEAIRAARSGAKLSVLMVDADRFKRINDRFGHGAGDEVLRDLAALMKSALRGSDMVARYGGEEFVAVLLDTTSEAALGVAEKLRAAVAGFTFSQPDGRTLPPQTVSVGVATLRGTVEDVEAMIERSDRALYAAKQSGRNRVVAWSDELGDLGEVRQRVPPEV